MDNTELPVNAVGPGLEEERLPQTKSPIEGFDDTQFVELFNPMTVPFVGQVGMTKPYRADMPIGGADDPQSPNMTKTEADVRNTYGFDLRSNAQQQGKMHIRQRLMLQPGESKKFLGSEAQVLAMQLATAILQQEGHSNLNDPALRDNAMRRIIRSSGSIRAQMEQLPQTERAQMQATLDQMNDKPVANAGASDHEETEFPDAAPELAPESSEQRAETNYPINSPRRGVGRPPKAA